MNICVQVGRESRGIVSPFSPTSVCNLVCVSCREMLEIYAHAEAVGQRDLRSTVDLLYWDIIPNITTNLKINLMEGRQNEHG